MRQSGTAGNIFPNPLGAELATRGVIRRYYIISQQRQQQRQEMKLLTFLLLYPAPLAFWAQASTSLRRLAHPSEANTLLDIGIKPVPCIAQSQCGTKQCCNPDQGLCGRKLETNTGLQLSYFSTIYHSIMVF